MAQLTIQQTFDLALGHHQAGRLGEAESLYRQILARQSENLGALRNLALIAHQSGQSELAVDLLRRAIALMPNDAEIRSDLGIALKHAGQLDEAIAAYRLAIVLNPGYAEVYNNLGNALKQKGDLDEAIGAYRRAIALRPDFAGAHHNLGVGLSEMGQFDESIAAYRQAIVLKPNYAEAHNNLGNSLKQKDRLDEAIAAFRQAIAVNINTPEAFDNLGNALKHKGELDEAIAVYRQAAALDPDNAPIDSSLLYILHFHPDYDAQALAEEHRGWNHRRAEPLRKLIQTHSNERGADRRLRIGYLSPDFGNHVVGRHLLPLFEQHDRGQFEIICYAQVPRPDAMTRQLRQMADCWRNIVGLSDEQAAKQIREDRIDVLVDLALHTPGNRLLVFARKPAPVQVSYLGYCGSTGMSTMDYRMSDPHLDPPDTDLSCYSEKTLRLPRTYWCYRPIATPASSSSPALDNGFITFGCLNNFVKVSTGAIELWARILAAVPNSQMIIHAPSGTHRDDVAERFERAGVATDRVLFVGTRPSMEYLQTFSRIDIALDPFPYGGGISTCDALWMGVPVVTLSGKTAVGRGGRSILTNLGLTELIAFTQDQYVQIAVDLAKDRDRTDALRQGMRARMQASPLMDAAGFARDIEAAYRQMWRTWCETVV